MMPDHAQLMARATCLVSTLRARVAEAEQLRRLPDANVAELRAAGLFKLLQARRYGGFEMSLHAHIDTVAEIARGCGSTAWCMGVVHAHSWLVGSFPHEAQAESYGANPDAIVCAVIAPRGKARAVRAATGSTGFGRSRRAVSMRIGCCWAARSPTRAARSSAAELLVPARDIVIRDDWNVVGLRGTGSCSIVANDVFVPKHRYLSLPGIIAGEAPGAAVHDTSLYKSAAVPVFMLAITPAALGMAEAALAAFKERLPGREIAYTEHEIQINSPTTHRQVADAATRIHVARLLLHRCADDIEAAAAQWIPSSAGRNPSTAEPLTASTFPLRHSSLVGSRLASFGTTSSRTICSGRSLAWHTSGQARSGSGQQLGWSIF
jgi:3-hydroxy-9,10-secoandrosta-1,3,5(10)-triene-9,17-dione monooxygenase